MNVTCPQCRTVYRLPEEKLNSGAKLRCSVCRHVFLFEMNDEYDAHHPLGKASTVFDQNNMREQAKADSFSPENEYAEKERGLSLEPDQNEQPSSLGSTLDLPEERKPQLRGVFGLLLCAAIGAGGWWAWENTAYLDGIKPLILPFIEDQSADEAVKEPESLVSKLELRAVKQYATKNKYLGNLVVIKGKVRNTFDTPRELIQLEAGIYDEKDVLLASKKQLAGTSMSSFQLEVLNREELENALNSCLDIISSNLNVLPFSEIPFVVVFSDIPANAKGFKVRIVDASIPERKGNLSQ